MVTRPTMAQPRFAAACLYREMSRTAAILILLALTGSASADDAPTATQKGEVIVIEDAPPPPKVKAKPPKRWLPQGELDNVFLRKAPKYSEDAIMSDRWSMAWLLLDIDANGAVTRVKFLKYPGQNLEKIAVETARKLKFEPALDDRGRRVRSYLVFPIEWPSYWWLVARTELATGIPDVSHIPCRGRAPLNLGSVHPAYRDCEPPDWSKVKSEPWLTVWPERPR